MKKHPNHRRSIRLPDYDYTQPGAYFVTLCTQDRQCLFGEIVNGEMVFNEAGSMIERWWGKLAEKFPFVELDSYVIMPNHLHGVIIIIALEPMINMVGADPCVRPDLKPVEDSGAHTGAPLQKIIQWFKSMTSNEYIRGVKNRKWRPFNKHIWQRGYYEHVVRRTDKMNRIREYIMNNPLRWEFDRENPAHSVL